MTRTAIDLFAGAGGATQGLRDAGFEVIAAAENDPSAARSYAANHPGVVLAGDVRGVEPGRLRRYLGLQVGELDLLKACPPCQGFSSLGRGEVDDVSNDLVLDVFRFVCAFRPRAVLLENVPGLARDARLDVLVRAIGQLGYRHRQYSVDAQQFGVPQRRRRLIVLAVRNSDPGPPEDLLSAVPEAFDRRPRTAGEALAELAAVRVPNDPHDRHRKSRPDVAARIAAVPVGGTRFDLPPEMWLVCHTNLATQGRSVAGQATSSYGRVRENAPAPTMTTRCTTAACGAFVHPTENRSLTLREAATFQTFPADYKFDGGYDSIERQIGNAVPVRMAHGLGLAVNTLLDGATPPTASRAAPARSHLPTRQCLSAHSRPSIDVTGAEWPFGRSAGSGAQRGSPAIPVGHVARPGRGGQRPPRVSMAMAINASGVWNP